MKMLRFSAILFVGIALSLLAAEDKLAEKLKPALDVDHSGRVCSRTLKCWRPMNSKAARRGQKAKNFRSNTFPIEFKAIGLKPGNPDGSYFQEVPLAGIKSDPKLNFVIGKPRWI